MSIDRTHPDWPKNHGLVAPQMHRGHNRPLTEPEVNEALRELLDVLESNTEELHDRSIVAAIAEKEYRVAKAKALLVSQRTTVGMKEAEAIVETQDELLARNIAVALRDSAQDAIRTRRAELEAVRTLAASARTNETGRG